ncbi:acetylxylan esterase [Blastopirellula sp. JC732]|uniref:Acetylxylan esterase n=1 Tax=Blastopirellula sediminis TaxID=2894196 RepID=A0A9X1SGT5_9BACT|nr:acetylxylan esterase [Blastopirellula sediminis]MCC9607385.1 acetylxylan esterase [Blastopirellula sediminis]MCC9629322.1 acetylxylan esterase [Blastopirellula sediminis]
MRLLLSLSFALTLAMPSFAQDIKVLYDEAELPKFTLPDPLVAQDGTKITTREAWEKIRRPELLQLFETDVYGKAPAAPPIASRVISEREVFGGKATERQVRIFLTGKEDGPYADLILFLPKSDKPVPVVTALNFKGNHSLSDDPTIPLPQGWMRNIAADGIKNHTATEESRGAAKSRWPLERILDRGYAVATAYYGDIDPDFDDDFQNGIHAAFKKEGQAKPAADEWGSIAGWAFGLSRIADYLEQQDAIDHERMIVMGHSRLGKTSLWAGATDTRFDLVISNNSGCGGAALSRRRFGESVRRINTSFPHWFCDNFLKYNDNEDACPVDQHELIALIAPRPVLICSAQEDQWADPHGEFLSGLYADPVYRLLGTDGLAATEMPPLDKLINSRIGYRIRPGKHDVTPSDWEAYLDFADKQLGGK